MVGYFHWPLLANVHLATRLITAFGPANWCREMILRWAGNNAHGLASLEADSSLAVYEGFFAQPQTLVASNKDYEAGATVDVERERRFQEDLLHRGLRSFSWLLRQCRQRWIYSTTAAVSLYANK